ncbi:MAG: hypothetical protein JW909_12475 [Planctomycetes bacterium]|nr:hypothetical protein [Planctomycetota bacterium]
MNRQVLDRGRAEEILEAASGISVAVTGDVCLDSYWSIDMRLSELSRETPHYMKPVVAERYSPGAGGNVAVSLKTLGAGDVQVATVLGDDWRGRQLVDILGSLGIGAGHTVLSPDWTTTAFIKPMLRGFEETTEQEDARLDFVNSTEAGKALVDEWMVSLDAALKDVDALVVMDQVAPNLVTRYAAGEIVKEAGRHAGKIFLADSRYKAEAFGGMWIKGNDIEIKKAAAAVGLPGEDPESAAANVSGRLAGPVVMTMGEKGAFVVPGAGVEPVLAACRPATGELDICGAGDAFTAAFVLALAAGASPAEAAGLGNASARYAVQQVGATGNPAAGDVLDQLR